MGQAGVGAGHHDGVKGQTRAAAFIHTIDQLRLQLQLRHTDPDSGQYLRECLVGDLLGLLHEIDLPFFLGSPEVENGLVEGHQLGVQVLLVALELCHGEVILLVAQGSHTEIGNGIVDALEVVPVAIHHLHLEVLQVVLGALNVAAVGEIAAAGPGDDGHALGDVIFRAVVAAVAGGQQQTVHFPIQQGQILFQIFHVSILLFLAIKINGSSSTCRAFSQKL